MKLCSSETVLTDDAEIGKKPRQEAIPHSETRRFHVTTHRNCAILLKKPAKICIHILTPYSYTCDFVLKFEKTTFEKAVFVLNKFYIPDN